MVKHRQKSKQVKCWLPNIRISPGFGVIKQGIAIFNIQNKIQDHTVYQELFKVEILNTSRVYMHCI